MNSSLVPLEAEKKTGTWKKLHFSRRTVVSLAAGAIAALGLNLLVQANQSGIIDLAKSTGWTSTPVNGSEWLVHRVPGGWMVRTPGHDPELALFYPNPDHTWQEAVPAGEQSELAGEPVLRTVVPGGWLMQRVAGSKPATEPFFVPDAEHDGVFDARTALIFAVNGFDFEAVNGEKT